MKLYEFVQEHMVTHLLQLCKKELDINELPPIQMLDDEPTVGGGTSFGEFDGNAIQVVTQGRHPMDVMRTLAHELVHWQQMNQGLELDGSDGSEIENEANAKAGVIMRKFAKMYPDYFVDSLPGSSLTEDSHPECEHDWQPVEKMRAVYRCPKCETMGNKKSIRTPYGFNSGILPYRCTTRGCEHNAVKLMTRRGGIGVKSLTPYCADHIPAYNK